MREQDYPYDLLIYRIPFPLGDDTIRAYTNNLGQKNNKEWWTDVFQFFVSIQLESISVRILPQKEEKHRKDEMEPIFALQVHWNQIISIITSQKDNMNLFSRRIPYLSVGTDLPVDIGKGPLDSFGWTHRLFMSTVILTHLKVLDIVHGNILRTSESLENSHSISHFVATSHCE